MGDTPAERIRIPRITIIRITTKSFWWNTIRRKRRTRYYCITHGGISIRLTVTDNFAITDLRIVPRYFTMTTKNAKLPTGYEKIIKENNNNNNASSLSLLWNENNIAVPILSKPKFWLAEEYHQNYYIKNPGTYNYYKKRCGRENRLKQVWGEEVYYCYHDLKSSCFRNITNTNGTIVRAQVNIKNIPVGKASILPKKISIFIIVLSSIVAIVIMITCRLCCLRKQNKKRKRQKKK